MYKLRPHQIKFSKKILEVLNTYKIAYLAGEVRSQKTLTALEAARLYGAGKVIVITKKKAIPSILSDYEKYLTRKRFHIWVSKYASFINADFKSGISNGVKWFEINNGGETQEIPF